MSTSSSGSKSGVFARYSLVDKTSGLEVGLLLLPEGQAVPDLGQVELKICESKTDAAKQILVADVEDSGVANSLDANGVKEKSESLPSPSIYKKPGQFGWIRKVTLSSTGSSVTSVTYIRIGGVGKNRRKFKSHEGIRRFLLDMQNQDLNIGNFCLERRVLGLENMEVIERHTMDINRPFMLGWLRIVTIRSSDMRVTCLRYLTPPDSNGRRLSKTSKKDLEKYLNETDNKDLDLEDFVTARKVLGLSPEFEIIKYSDQPYLTSNNVDEGVKKKKEYKSDPTEYVTKSVSWQNDSSGSSLETLDDSTFSSPTNGTSNVSNRSDSPNSNIPHLSTSPDFSIDTNPSGDTDYNISPAQTAGMKMFGVKFGLDFRNLRFFSGGSELTGEELAWEFNGAKIVVEELG